MLRGIYMLSSCVCLSVTSRYCIEKSGRIEQEASFHLSHTVPIGIYPKMRLFPSETLSQTPDLENFATASRSRCHQNSTSSSTVEFVDDTYTTVDESWLFTTSRSTVTLHYFDLLWICCTRCWLAQRVARSVCVFCWCTVDGMKCTTWIVRYRTRRGCCSDYRTPFSVYCSPTRGSCWSLSDIGIKQCYSHYCKCKVNRLSV